MLKCMIWSGSGWESADPHVKDTYCWKLNKWLLSCLSVAALGVQCSVAAEEPLQCVYKECGVVCAFKLPREDGQQSSCAAGLVGAPLCCKGLALITKYLESVFCQQCCAAKTTNARSNHHNVSLLDGLLCLAWLLQGGASSCLSPACCHGSGSF